MSILAISFGYLILKALITWRSSCFWLLVSRNFFVSKKVFWPHLSGRGCPAPWLLGHDGLQRDTREPAGRRPEQGAAGLGLRRHLIVHVASSVAARNASNNIHKTGRQAGRRIVLLPACPGPQVLAASLAVSCCLWVATARVGRCSSLRTVALRCWCWFGWRCGVPLL